MLCPSFGRHYPTGAQVFLAVTSRFAVARLLAGYETPSMQSSLYATHLGPHSRRPLGDQWMSAEVGSELIA